MERESVKNNIQFEITMMLRSILDEISDGSVSEKILDSMETIEVLDRKGSYKVVESMQRAYCTVAIECTVKYLVGTGAMNRKYFDAVTRVFNRRTGDLNQTGGHESVCFSDELVIWREKLREAMWDNKVCTEVMKLNTRNDALRMVRIYAQEALALSGPQFVQVLTKKTKEEKKELSSESQECKNGLGESNTEMKSTGAPIEVIELENDKDPKDDNRGSGDDANELRGLKGQANTSKVSVVYDRATPNEKDFSKNPSKPSADEVHHGDEPVKKVTERATDEKDEPNQSKEGRHGSQYSDLQNDVATYSLMKRKRIAHTYDWDDSIDGSAEAAPSPMKRSPLSSSKGKTVSPMKKDETPKFIIRRKTTRWMPQEEDVLREAVKKYGKGHWKAILLEYKDVFQERTEVNLKDKWRSMTK